MVTNYKVKVTIVTIVMTTSTATATTTVTPDVGAAKGEAIRTTEGAVPEENIVGLAVTATIPAGTEIRQERVTKIPAPSKICTATVQGIANDGVGRYIV